MVNPLFLTILATKAQRHETNTKEWFDCTTLGKI